MHAHVHIIVDNEVLAKCMCEYLKFGMTIDSLIHNHNIINMPITLGEHYCVIVLDIFQENRTDSCNY